MGRSQGCSRGDAAPTGVSGQGTNVEEGSQPLKEGSQSSVFPADGRVVSCRCWACGPSSFSLIVLEQWQKKRGKKKVRTVQAFKA